MANIFFATAFAQTQSINIIPKPASIAQQEGVFEFGKQTNFIAPANNQEVSIVADFLVEMLKRYRTGRSQLPQSNTTTFCECVD